MAGVSALFRGFGEGERSRRPPRARQDDPRRALHRARDLEPREPQAARLLPLEQRVARRSPRLPYRSRGSRGSAQWQDHRPDHLEHPLDRSRRAPDAGGARVSARHRHERRDARDPGQCDRVARAVAESRWRHNRGEVVQPYAGDRSRGNVAARAVPLLHRPRQQPRLVRVYPGGDAAHRGFAVQRVASPDRARHSPDGFGGGASVSAALSRPSRAEHRSPVDRWGQRVGQRYGVGARVTGEDRHLDQLDVRCLDAGAGLSALPRRGTHSVGDRERESRVAGGHYLRPWRGGRWTIRDIVSYQTEGAYALLVHAAKQRERWLSSFLTVEGRATRGWREWPYAYVIPARQDSVALSALLGILRRGGVEIRTALQSFTLQGQRHSAGSYVIVMRQPYASFAKTLLEVQHYPDRRLYPGGPPERPYDVTAHTLPLLMGV